MQNTRGRGGKIRPGCIQVIENTKDEEDTLEFSLEEKSFNEWLEVSKLDSFKDKPDYSFVAIMGPQSSGKSTIMNQVFGCEFAVLDAKKAREQTTQGIWFGSSPKARDIVCLDLEGTDSAQRKENRHNLERQTALFALTITELLIVNMWSNQVGLASGMNIETLRAIVEANLRLFTPDSKTILLFLIREQPSNENQPGTTSKGVIQEILTKEIQKIWDSIEKPASFKESTIDALFTIKFFFLPPMHYEQEAFKKAVRDLRQRFIDPQNENFLFDRESHYSKSVPMNGLYQYCTQIWDAVYNDEALNIPAQQKLLASWKGSSVIRDVMAEFVEDLKPLLNTLETEIVQELGNELSGAFHSALKKFNERCQGYAEEEVTAKQVELKALMMVEAKEVVLKHLEYVHKEVADRYEKQLVNVLPQDMCSSDFMSDVKSAIKDAKQHFWDYFEQVNMKTDKGVLVWDPFEFWERTEQRLREINNNLRISQSDRLDREITALTLRKLCRVAEQTFKHKEGDVWINVSKDRSQFHQRDVQRELHSKIEKLGFETGNSILVKRRLIKSSDTELLLHMERMADRFENILNKRFVADFGSEKDGSPRVWYPGLNVKRLYNNAKINCLNLLDSFQRAVLEKDQSLTPPLPEECKNLLDNDAIVKLTENFENEALREFRNAMNEQQRRADANRILPTHPIAWAVLLYLGKEEIYWVITNPFMLFLVMICAGVFFALLKMQEFGLVGDWRGALELLVSTTFRGGLNLVRSFVDNNRNNVANMDRGRHVETEMALRGETKKDR